MKTLIRKLGLTSVMLALFIGCVQPPAAPNGEIETSDEAGNTVTTQAVPTNGLKGDYCDNVDFTGTLKTRYDANVNRTWNSNAPISGIQPTTYSVRWTGQVMPAFSQTYTFFVTSSDGARLMVNGQVLVNDWVDGASRARSGTVALQANTRYDIRLEYYRNATNPGAVKLEWQSSSRSKQVVPQASLFPTGSNTADALTVVKSANGFPAGVDFDQLQAAGTKVPNGFTIIARERNSVNFVIAALLNNSITVLYRVVNDGGQLTLTDVLTKASTSLGTVSQYVNADGTSTDAQKEALKKQFVLLLSQGVFVAGSIQSTGVVRPQVVSWICEARVLPPPACEICVDTAARYRDTVCSSAGALSALVIGGLVSVVATPVVGGAVAFVIGAPDLPTLFALPSIPQELSDRWSRYLACIEGRLGGSPTCKMAIAVDNVDEVKPVNSKGFVAITVRNKPAPDADASLEYGVRFKDRTGIIGVSISSGDFLRNDGGRLTPGSSRPVRVEYECPSVPTVLRLELYIDNNSNNPSGMVIGTATVRCDGGPKISVTPNPLELVAALNSSSIGGKLTVSNTGDAPLTVSNIFATQGWVTGLTPTNFTVAPGSSQIVDVTGTCGSIKEQKPDAIIEVYSTSLPRQTVTARLFCTTNVKPDIRFGEMGWGYPFGGYSDPSCGPEKENVRSKISFNIWRYDSLLTPPGNNLIIEYVPYDECGGNDTFYRLIDKAKAYARSRMSAVFQDWKSRNTANVIYSSPWTYSDQYTPMVYYVSYGDR